MLSVVGSQAFCIGTVAPGDEGITALVALDSVIMVALSSGSESYLYWIIIFNVLGILFRDSDIFLRLSVNSSIGGTGSIIQGSG